MKIEIELDDADVLKMVTDKLVDRLRYEAQEHVRKMLGLAFMEDIRARVGRELDDIFMTLTLGDGRTFRQLVEDLLLRPGKPPYDARPRLTLLVEQRIYAESDRIFAEIVKPHVEEFKKKLRENVVGRLMREAG